jgi:alkylhydroperoxidase/carboxymuconolactone decarboxylase family protein YurZ
MTTLKSSIMTELYGNEISDTVYQRCEELSPEFNKIVQEIVYDIFWKKEGLPLLEKSIVTIISLIFFGKEEQLRIHLKGYFNLGGSADELSEIISYMKSSQYIHSSEKALNILKEVSGKVDFINVLISHRHSAITELVSNIARGDNNLTTVCLIKILKENTLTIKDIENILLHQAIYCGFPCAMNGFAVLKKINNELI